MGCKELAQARRISAPWLFAACLAVVTARSIKEMEMNNLHPAFAAALAPFAPPSSFTDEQLLEADRHPLRWGRHERHRQGNKERQQ